MNANIVIIHPHSNLTFNVALHYLISRLIEEKFNVTIFTNCNLSKSVYGIYNHVKIEKLPLLYPRAPRRPLLYLTKTLLPLLNSKKVLFNKNNRYICIDPEGLQIAKKMFPSRITKMNYISHEMFFLDELKENRAIRYHQEEGRILRNGIKSLIIPDKYRLKLLLKEHQIEKKPKTFFIPVSPHESLFKKKLQSLTSENKTSKKVIYSGSLYDWSGVKGLISSTQNWDSKFELFIHSHNANLEMRKDLENMIHHLKVEDRVKIIDINLNNEEYLIFISQFDIGIASYIPFTSDSPYDGKNFAEIGYSSSKFNTFMMLGIPTIATRNNSFLDIKKTFDFGYIIDDFSEMKTALDYVDANFETLKKEACNVYQTLLNPEECVTEFINFIKSN